MLTLQYRLRRGRVVAGFVVAAVMIYGGSLVLQVIGALYDHDHIFGLLPLLHVDREGNLAAWLSTITLMASGAVAWAVAENPGPMMRASSIAWRITALVLFAMSIDEAAQLHEWVGGRVQPFLPSWGPLYFGWVAVGALVVFGTLPFFVRFVRSLPHKTRLQVSTAAILFFSGALGVEIVTGVYMSVAEDKLSLTYIALSHVEEMLEISGSILLLAGLLAFGAAGGIANAASRPAHRPPAMSATAT